MGGNRVGGAVRERETLRVGEAIGRNRVRQIGEGRGKMPLVASHSDAYMQAKHAHAHADLQSRLHFIVSLLAKEITSGALNQINKVRGVSELSLLHLRILTALQWWAARKPTLNQRDIERAGHSRDYIFFPTVDSSRFIENRFAGLLHLGRFAIFLQNIVLASCCPRFPPFQQNRGSSLDCTWESRRRWSGSPRRCFELWMLTHSFWTRGEPDPAWATQADATATDISLGFTSWYQPFSWPALQHVPFCEALPSLPSSRTMCKWNVIKGASAWFRLSCLSLPLLLLLLCSALPVACHDTHRAVRAPRGTNSSSPALVGRHVRSYNHLMGDVHKRKLFSFQKFFLRINKNGKVKGTKSKDDPYSE